MNEPPRKVLKVAALRLAAAIVATVVWTMKDDYFTSFKIRQP